MADKPALPTLGEVVSEWLGFQLPTIPLPQAVKNLDKAISKVVLATGENWEAHIKARTAKTKAQGKIDSENLFRSEDEKRKFENRAASTKIAIEDMRASPPSEDAQSEIEDDWLNYYSRLAEDKSSEELRILFGRILAGEIRQPGTFSLRTMQILATISKSDAARLSSILSFVVNEGVLPQTGGDGEPDNHDRLFLQELGVGGHPGGIGALTMNYPIQPGAARLFVATGFSLVVENGTDQVIQIPVAGQTLTSAAPALLQIANCAPTPQPFLISLGSKIREAVNAKQGERAKTIKVHLVSVEPAGHKLYKYNIIQTIE